MIATQIDTMVKCIEVILMSLRKLITESVGICSLLVMEINGIMKQHTGKYAWLEIELAKV